MAFRLGESTVRGELFNTRRNSVHGWIQLRGEERPLAIELTGNCDPDLAGWHFRFETRPQENRGWDSGADDEEDKPDLSGLQWHQIGPTGEMTAARRVKHADCTAKELWIRAKLKELPPMRWVRCLYLEWYSQNGRVVVEIPDPILEFVERKKLEGVPMAETQIDPVEPDPVEEEPGEMAGGETPALEVTTFQRDENGDIEIRQETYRTGDAPPDKVEPDRGEFGLVPDELQQSLDAHTAEVDRTVGGDDVAQEIREMELMDHLIDHGSPVPLCSIFDEPMRLPRPEDLDDRQVEIALKSVLTQLAMCGVALHMCEHFSPRDAYKLLVEKVLYEEEVFKELKGTGWMQNFMTSEYCKQCEAEAESELSE